MKRLLLFPILAVAAVPATAAPPAAPSNVVLYAPANNRPHLSWKDNSSDEEKFIIEYKVGSGSFNVDDRAEFPPNFEVARFTGGAGGTFVFRIAAVKGSEQSAWVESAAVEIPAPNVGLGVVEGLGGIAGETYQYDIPHGGSVSIPDGSYFIQGFPAGTTVSAQGRITGKFPSAGVHRTFYGVTVGGKIYKQVFYLRVNPSKVSALAVTKGQTRVINIRDTFQDPLFYKIARFTTTRGHFDVLLYDKATPKTVVNFLNYVNRNDYTNSLIHRSVDPPNIIQGGGFLSLEDRTSADWTRIATDPVLANEPGFSNIGATIAMAKLGGDQDSATSQWYVNVTSNDVDLDANNGGFTVFGHVLGNGMQVVEEIRSLPTGNYNVTVQGFDPFLYEGVPMDAATAPPDLDASREVLVNSIEELTIAEGTIESNSAPTAVGASLSGDLLTLRGLAAGTSTITLRSENQKGESQTHSFTVTVSNPVVPTPPRDTKAPTARITAPATKGKFPRSGKLRIAGAATDNVALAKWQYRLNGSSWKSGGTLSGTSKSFAKTVGGFKRKTNKLDIRVFDKAGRVSSIATRKVTLK